MDCGVFEIGWRHERTGSFRQTVFKPANLLSALSLLKHVNARGHHIYIRPAGPHGLILPDDLARDALGTLKQDGLPPAAVIETSPGNYQAWIKFLPAPHGLPHAPATQLARLPGHWVTNPASMGRRADRAFAWSRSPRPFPRSHGQYFSQQETERRICPAHRQGAENPNLFWENLLSLITPSSPKVTNSVDASKTMSGELCRWAAQRYRNSWLGVVREGYRVGLAHRRGGGSGVFKTPSV
ncbi:MAG: DNA-primase RepB domain-containing protein [Acidobacteriota bacterium]|nr:DNA-primase RepB domain-containing protein [Acidobacteriota bacterium]